jgi:uncharacterized protein YndB with AHSA1/START domain
MSSNTDRIAKKVLLRAPRARVWRAISDSKEFGTWFGVRFDGPFAADQRMIGKIVPTAVDPEVAKLQEPHEGMTFEFAIDRIEPQTLFSFRWHPYAVDSSVDYTKEPSTLVVFELQEVAGGTILTVTESGFDRIPIERRASAFAANEGGWTHQMKLIENYLAHAA